MKAQMSGPLRLQFTSSGVGPENVNFSSFPSCYHEAAGFLRITSWGGKKKHNLKVESCVSFGELAEDSRLGE